MSENQCQRIAVFIDGENVMPIYADYVFMYAEEQGTIVRKEIYGASIALNDWSDPIMKYAIHMNLTIRPTRFKNTSDIALTVGAMDLLTSHTVSMLASTILDGKPIAHAMQAIGFERIDSVIIVSSDSDFSVLSLRLRNAGINVIGMGEEKSNAMWKAACSSFVTFRDYCQRRRTCSNPRPQDWQSPNQRNTKNQVAIAIIRSRRFLSGKKKALSESRLLTWSE